ncbi:MAG TPA: hypothetical protein VKK31_13520 [Thermoanaerobaculia bacterium]|nr:hypothetical protein [Thermoanaerobaculia bacterium]
MLTAEQIKTILKFTLTSFNQGEPVTDETVFNTILSETNGFTPATSSKRIFKSLVRFGLANNNHPDVAWPTDWMDKTIAELAEILANTGNTGD